MIPITKTTLGDEERDAIQRVLQSGWIMQGPEVAAFEREVAAYVEADGACAVSSGTAALHLIWVALGLRPGDEVITVSHSFIATANSIRLAGATPVFVDVERATRNLDATLLCAAIGPRTRAILVVHQLGLPCDLDAVLAIANEHGLPVVEDAACAMGSRYRSRHHDRPIGSPHGVAAAFSFHPRKLVTTGDGGLVTTRDPALLLQIRALRQHGTLDGVTFPDVGFNYRMTDLQAAVGRCQLKRLPELLAERRRQVARYVAALSGRADLELPVEPEGRTTNWQSFAIRLVDRDAAPVVAALQTNGISVRGGLTNAHEQPAYANSGHPLLPVSQQLTRETLMLPLFPGLTENEQIRVVSTLVSSL